jgi:hypothetical protein
MYILISLFIIILTVAIVKDTHATLYKPCSNRIEKEYNWELSVGLLLLIILVGLIPIINCLSFIIFIVSYIVFSHIDGDDFFPKLSLRGTNIITKSILNTIKLLKIKI